MFDSLASRSRRAIAAREARRLGFLEGMLTMLGIIAGALLVVTVILGWLDPSNPF